MVAHQNAAVSLRDPEKVPAPGARTLRRYATDDGDDPSEKARTQTSRNECFSQTKALRRKYVTLVSAAARGLTAAMLQTQYESTAAHRFQGKVGESHRIFVFSGDLFAEAPNAPWLTTPDIVAAEEVVKFMLQQTSAEDVLLFCDGRSRVGRKKLEGWLDHARHLSELWVVYQASRRLGRRVCFASDNREVLLVSMPVQRNHLATKGRTSFNAVGEASTHDSTYTGVEPLPWARMPRLSKEDKQKILGGPAEIPKDALYDSSLGVPLFWNERKTVQLWAQILEDLDAKAVYDLTPGTGTLARACLDAGLTYTGVALNGEHRQWLDTLLDRLALKAGAASNVT